MKEIEGAIAATSGKKNRLVISLDMFEGIKLFNIRQWFVNKSGEWSPTKKGVSLSKEKFDFLLRAIKDHEEEVYKWLEDGEDTTHREVSKTHEASLEYREKAMFTKRPYELEKESWRSPEFFRVEAQGGEDKLILNIDHPFIQTLLEITNDSSKSGDQSEKEIFLDMVKILLLSFARTQRLFEEGQTLDQETFFELIMTNWGLLTQRYLNKSRGANR